MSVDFKSLPKIELHCHLDASVRVSTVAELGRKIGLSLPTPLEPALIAPECCIDLADYLVRIDLALEVMQHRAAASSTQWAQDAGSAQRCARRTDAG